MTVSHREGSPIRHLTTRTIRGFKMADSTLPTHNDFGIKVKRDLVGERFGRLLVVSRAPDRTSKAGIRQPRWNCMCDCGSSCLKTGPNLTSGGTMSCGCLRVDYIKNNRSGKGHHGYNHGAAGSPEYNSWVGARLRCHNEKDKNYNNYGGRGISLCDRWRNSFSAFLEDMGERPLGTTLDRIDVNGNYEKSNCRWASTKQQGRNMRKTIWITIGDRTLSVPEWSEISGIPEPVIRQRYRNRGWAGELAVFHPILPVGKKLVGRGS